MTSQYNSWSRTSQSWDIGIQKIYQTLVNTILKKTSRFIMLSFLPGGKFSECLYFLIKRGWYLLSFIKNVGRLAHGLCKHTWRKNKVMIMAAMMGREERLFILSLLKAYYNMKSLKNPTLVTPCEYYYSILREGTGKPATSIFFWNAVFWVFRATFDQCFEADFGQFSGETSSNLWTT